MGVSSIPAMLARLFRGTTQIVNPRKRENPPRNQPIWRQGDVFITRVDAIPAQVRHSPLPHGILVHGELTGHSHRIENPMSAALFSGMHVSGMDGIGELFLDVPARGTRIVHEEHGPIEMTQGFYRVWRQREYTPQAIVPVRD